MKGLTPEAKSDKFNSHKIEVNNRLKDSYEKLHSIEAKVDFYDEAFSWLGEYHSDYLMINLFFENEFSTIYSSIEFPHYINQGNSFGSDLSGLLTQASTEYNINEVIKGKISKEFDLNPNDWNNHERHSHPIVNKWANKMAKHSEDYEEFLSKTLWFEKSWQMTFENRTPALKATIFLAKLMSELDANSDDKMTFARNYLKYEKERDDLFTKKINQPLFYGRAELEILNFNGVYVQKNKFDAFIADYTNIEKLGQLGYYQLFENLKGENQIVRDKVFDLINEKLNNSKLPSKDDVDNINSLTNSDELTSLRTHLFRRAYLFEFKDL